MKRLFLLMFLAVSICSTAQLNAQNMECKNMFPRGGGYYAERGDAIRKLLPGDVVRIAPDVEHWHGATADSWFSHLSIETNVSAGGAVWLEPVTDAHYGAYK